MLKFIRPTLVTLTAPTASGKNYLRDAIEERFGWNRIISTTTRPMRNGEVDGVDYHFITREYSQALQDVDAFAELITFRGTRYGVTRSEMDNKMDQELPPMVILEPLGLEVYRHMCSEMGWDMFSIFVSTLESTRIERLIQRTALDLETAVGLDAASKVEALVRTHTDRLLSITGDERRWSQISNWDAILPGDDLFKALNGLETAVNWRNRKNTEPSAYDHYARA